MDSSQICRAVAYEEEYKSYILDTGGNIGAVRRKFDPTCIQQIDGSLAVLYQYQPEPFPGGLFAFNGYSSVPKCYGLLDTLAVEATGALRIRRRPGFELNGQGVLLGLVDTGIDVRNPLFQEADGTSRVLGYWDQADDSGKPPEGFYYGTEYDKEQIDETLREGETKDSLLVEDYHGSFLAAVAAGNEDRTNEFTGMAPKAKFLAVKLKETKNYLRQFYGIRPEVPCFQEDDIMLAVRYLWQKARILRMPVVICMGLGTNSGSHTGYSPFGTQLSRMSTVSGVCVVC